MEVVIGATLQNRRSGSFAYQKTHSNSSASLTAALDAPHAFLLGNGPMDYLKTLEFRERSLPSSKKRIVFI
jgi:hypothetical protein